MKISTKLEQLHRQARKNKWLQYFAVFNRIALALGFLPSGMQKVLGERFTVLAVNHPMGNFLEAFHHTGYYYTFVGVMQVLAAILLLIPRTVTLGAFIYFPIILNICILSLAVRFDGSQITSPLMLCGVLYLLCWDYHKFKNIFPFNHQKANDLLPSKTEFTAKFPTRFFTVVFIIILAVASHTSILYQILPRNTISDCQSQCSDKMNTEDCLNFCDCIHSEGKPLDVCLNRFSKNSEKD